MSDLCNHDLLERSVDGTCSPAEGAGIEAHMNVPVVPASDQITSARERAAS